MATTTREFETILDFAPDQTAQALLNLRCAVDHCHDAVFIMDSTGKIEFVNAAFEALIGYSAAEAMDGGLALIMERTAQGSGDAEAVTDPSRAPPEGDPPERFLPGHNACQPKRWAHS